MSDPIPYNQLSDEDRRFVDECAMRAMAALITAPPDAPGMSTWLNNATDDQVANEAYRRADAMLAEKKRREGRS